MQLKITTATIYQQIEFNMNDITTVFITNFEMLIRLQSMC